MKNIWKYFSMEILLIYYCMCVRGIYFVSVYRIFYWILKLFPTVVFFKPSEIKSH